MDAAKWSQGFQDIGFVKPMEEMGSNTCTSRGPVIERKTKPAEQLNCPRCNSTNTKFCYYNNYSLTQPRYFCKSCRRYWTEGGSLRNVPVGGGSRKNKRSTTSYSSTSSASASAKVPDLNPTNFTHLMSSHQNPNNKNHKSQQDLNLGFPAAMQEAAHGLPQYLQLPKQEQITSTQLSALELLRTGMVSRGLNLFVPSDAAAAAAPTPDHHSTTQLYSTMPSGFTMKDYKPTLSFSIDGVNNENGGGRLFFPFGDLQMKPISSEMDDQNNQGQDNSAAAYWNNNHNGMLGGGGSW